VKVRQFAALLLVGVLAAFAPHDRTAPNSWALLIGVSDYMYFDDEIGGDLPGAAPDAMRMRDVLLARWGFQDDHIRLVLDREATRERIVRELTDWLPSVVKPGDLVFVFFAGHGSQTWSDDPDEPTGLDQTICPTDVRKGDPSMDIRDKELGGYLRALPTDNVVVVLDNCHAGTGTRALTPHMRPRFLARDVETDVARDLAYTPPPIPAPRHDNILEIAAAQSHEVAVDAEWPAPGGGESLFGGAFTTHLVRNLWRVPRRTSYQAIFAQTVEDMKRDRFAQQPMIQRGGREVTAADGQVAFATGAETGGDGAFVPVLGASGGVVRLGGGAAAGMTVGSIYRAGTVNLRVTAVDAAHAEAAIDGGGSAPRQGARAELVAYRYPARTLRVSLAGLAADTRAALQRGMGADGGIHFVTGARDFAHLLVRPAEGGGYAVIGLDGATRQRIDATGAAGLDRLRNALRNEAGAHQIASLENPAHPFPLEFGFDGGRSTFRIGELIRFDARVPRDGYLTIIDIGTNGNVVVLYPNELEPDNRVRAGQRIILPTAAMDMDFEAQEPAGRGIVRAFLTERPLELGFSVGEPEDAAAVVRALYAAVGAAGAGSAVPVGNWATSAVVYTIER
jgi:hypothetical protein